MSVKVIIERRFRENPNAEDLKVISELRIMALRQRGYIGGETVVNVSDRRDVLVLSAWSSEEDWRLWEADLDRARLEGALAQRLAEPTRIRVFRAGADYAKESLSARSSRT